MALAIAQSPVINKSYHLPVNPLTKINAKKGIMMNVYDIAEYLISSE
ncbi:TPA: hypothetical protein P2Q98_004694 [Aeromonas veronii]|nr:MULTISPECIES: hypothetical protein [Aeromonas]HDO1331887.1 hypothetical protein [Aeromonas veronii]HDO1336404.1 hypothetical protein [Aeromonas veronii]HDO1340956.1 hypothetical protein [Aeromonas veronii]HDO1345476.1 hypothetical protein [Aeromonas veronii]HDO1350046.1 hypothetical protein [Aeromonas veronii]